MDIISVLESVQCFALKPVSNHGPQTTTLEITEFRNLHREKLCHSFSPYGLYFDNNNLLYATDMQNSVVCVCNTSGKFLGYIGNSDGSSFDRPRFIVSDKDRLYISDDNGVVTKKCFQQ